MDLAIPAELRLFLDKVLEEAHGKDKLPEELKEKMLADLYNRLESHLFASLVQALPPEADEDFKKLTLSDPEQEQIDEFFNSKIPNVQDIMAKAMMEFKDIYVGAIKS